MYAVLLSFFFSYGEVDHIFPYFPEYTGSVFYIQLVYAILEIIMHCSIQQSGISPLMYLLVCWFSDVHDPRFQRASACLLGYTAASVLAARERLLGSDHSTTHLAIQDLLLQEEHTGLRGIHQRTRCLVGMIR